MHKTKKLNIKKNKHNSKFHSISTEVLKRTIITLAITVTLISLISLLYFNNIIIDVSEDKALASIHVIEKEFVSIKNNLENYVSELTSNEIIINSVKTKSMNNIQSYIKNLGEVETDYILTIADADGIITASSNDILKPGNSISNYLGIKAALKGNVHSEIGRVTAGFYGIYSSSPIYDNNEIIGVLSAYFSLEENKFLDNMKSVVNSEITIFEEDIRINTTIIQNEKRVVGTKLDSKVANIVINNKKEYIGKTDILGKPYTTVYKPILSSDGTVRGVLFTGSDYSAIEHKIINVAMIINLIALMSIIISSFVLQRYFRKRLKKPLDNVVKAAKAIETGEIDESIINQLESIAANDEIGSLARSMEGAVESVYLLAESIEGYKNAITKHDLTYTLDSSIHNGIYLTIIKIVENLFTELRTILSEINQAADDIDAGAEQVSSASQMLAQGAAEQAGSTEELAATISEISEQIKTDAISAIETSKLSDETGNVVLQSSQYMNDLINAMEEINQTSKEIEKIIKTINDIAFQTNILALNASVEAARAGAAGKGFAVVAEEVRNLSLKSADAVKSTTLLIDSSSMAVTKGFKIAKETEAELKNVVEKTNKANSLINKISEASQRQSDSIYQVNIGVDQISSIVQTNSATAEQIAASSEELSGQSHSLKEMVGKYIL